MSWVGPLESSGSMLQNAWARAGVSSIKCIFHTLKLTIVYDIGICGSLGSVLLIDRFKFRFCDKSDGVLHVGLSKETNERTNIQTNEFSCGP